jgi:hypothetical protein
MLRGGGGGVGVGLRRGQRRDNHPKSSAAAQNALQDGQTVILAVRDPIINTPATSAPSLTTTPIVDAAAPSTSTPATESEASLTAKNYRLAKELVRIDEILLAPHLRRSSHSAMFAFAERCPCAP